MTGPADGLRGRRIAFECRRTAENRQRQMARLNWRRTRQNRGLFFVAEKKNCYFQPSFVVMMRAASRCDMVCPRISRAGGTDGSPLDGRIGSRDGPPFRIGQRAVRAAARRAG
jgi:hypothetical protein